MKQKLSSPSFADLFLGQRKVKQTFFSQINTIIDWAPIRAIIEVAYTKGYKSTGRPSYDSLVLFKIELLRTWYGLSDGEVEDQVNDRLSFSRFAGLGMEDIVPDSTTVCRFRNILVEADLYDTFLRSLITPIRFKKRSFMSFLNRIGVIKPIHPMNYLFWMTDLLMVVPNWGFKLVTKILSVQK